MYPVFQREGKPDFWHANNKAANQPAHPRSLISAFVFHSLESIVAKLATQELQYSS